MEENLQIFKKANQNNIDLINIAQISIYEDFIDIFWENKNCTVLLCLDKKHKLSYYGDLNSQSVNKFTVGKVIKKLNLEYNYCCEEVFDFLKRYFVE